MRNAKRFVAFMTAMVLSSSVFVGCGSGKSQTDTSMDSSKKTVQTDTVAESTSDIEKLPEKNGFDESTNTELQVGNYILSIPVYFGTPEIKDDNTTYQWDLEKTSGGWNARVSASISNVGQQTNVTTCLNQFSNGVIESFKKLDGFNYSDHSVRAVQIAGNAGQYLTIDLVSKSNTNVKTRCHVYYFYDEDDSNIYSVFLGQLNVAEYSYLTDFEKIVESMHKVEVSANNTQNQSQSTVSSSAQQSQSTDQATQSNGQVTPELKAFLDSYEAFVDEYVVFMQKYQQNPTDTQLLSQYATIMGKYADFAQKINDYDSEESEMSTADLNYYIEVTARCSQKMLNAASSDN